MLVRLLFEENRCIGYLAYIKELYPYKEKEGIIMKETNDMELEEIIGTNWKEEYPKLILVDGQINVDETWETEQN